MTEAERIADQLERSFRGDPWYGASVVSVLDGVTAEEALAHPIAGAHSIWELVLHVTGWKREVLARFRGATAGEPPDGDWPAPKGRDEAAWRAALAALSAAHEDLLAAVTKSGDAHLDSPVRDERNRELGTGLAQWQTLHGVLQHDIYHLGQIALLRKALFKALST